MALGVSYELDLFGRLRSLSRAAAEQYLASDAAHYSVQVSLVADVTSAYLTWRSDQEQLALFGERFNNGTASQLNVRQARTWCPKPRCKRASTPSGSPRPQRPGAAARGGGCRRTCRKASHWASRYLLAHFDSKQGQVTAEQVAHQRAHR